MKDLDVIIKLIIILDYCKRCIENIFGYMFTMRDEQHPILNEFCRYVNYIKHFDLFYNTINFTQDQLHVALKLAIKHNNSHVIKTLLTYKYIPELYNYEYIFDDYPNKQDIFSSFFHKRFLIKCCIESINSELIDCTDKILNPYKINV